MSLLANSNAIESGGYNIDRSLRFRSSASAYLNRTLGTPTSELVWTISVWVKRGILSNDVKPIICATDGSGAPQESIWYRSGDYIQYYCDSDGTDKGNFSTNAVYRDPSAWYHYVLSRNGTTITLYVNNVTQSVTTATAIASYGVMNTSGRIQYLGFSGPSSYWNSYFDGYMTEFNFVDGQALTPSSFGETSTETGVWVPKKYTGTYGNNGSYLNFSDNTSATTLAYDKSGNGNNWTANNISTTAGSTYDSMLDVPTLTSATAANFATFNPLAKMKNGSTFFPAGDVSQGNLLVTMNADNEFGLVTFNGVSGKWYCEFNITNLAQRASIGVYSEAFDDGTQQYTRSDAGGSVTGDQTWTTNDVIQVAIDYDNAKVWFGKNNTWYNSGNPATNTNGTSLSFTVAGIGTHQISGSTGNTTIAFNAGQRPLGYTPPTGFKALNTFNLPDPTIKKPNQYMDVATYTGTGASKTISSNVDLSAGGMLWTKCRSNAQNHDIHSTGLTYNYSFLQPNTTTAETTDAPQYAITFNSGGGYTLGTGDNINQNTYTYVGWQWKESATAGFDIVTYTGTGSARTVSHSLGVAPSMMIVKRRDAVAAWDVYHKSIGATGRLYLNTTDSTNTSSAPWNDTAPTSSVFTVGTGTDTNASGSAIVAYLFAEIAGFSKFGSYIGNGAADGVFCYLGFRPKYVLIKKTSAGTASHWRVTDSSRDTYNVATGILIPSSSVAEVSEYDVDLLSNGFKLRANTTYQNGSGEEYIYAAFAESPFKYALGR